MKFQTIVIRQASNGFIMSIEPDYRHMEEINLRGHYTPPLDTICADEAAVVEAIRDALSMAKLTPPEQPEGTPASMPVEPMAEDSPEVQKLERILDGSTLSNPVVDHEDNELTGERTYIYLDGTRSKPSPAPASWRPNGSSD